MSDSKEKQLNELEEVVQQMLKKVKDIEDRKIEMPEIRIPDYSKRLGAIETELQRIHHSYPVGQIENQVKRIEALADRIPKKISRDYRFYFSDGSRGFIISMVGMILITVLSVGITVNAWIENKRLSDNSVKFRMVRQYYPVAARWANKAYYRDSGKAKEDIEKLEAEELIGK